MYSTFQCNFARGLILTFVTVTLQCYKQSSRMNRPHLLGFIQRDPQSWHFDTLHISIDVHVENQFVQRRAAIVENVHSAPSLTAVGEKTGGSWGRIEFADDSKGDAATLRARGSRGGRGSSNKISRVDAKTEGRLRKVEKVGSDGSSEVGAIADPGRDSHAGQIVICGDDDGGVDGRGLVLTRKGSLGLCTCCVFESG